MDAPFVGRRFVLAQFANADAMLEATRKLRDRSVGKLDTHTPYPVHGIEEALGLGRPVIPKIMFAGAIAGIISAVAMMTYMNVIDFPINVGNRPPLSLPAFVPITFELAILLAGTSAFFGLLIGLLKFPEPYHPLFEAESFARAAIDGFFVSVEVPAESDADDVLRQAREVGATEVQIVVESER